VSQNASRINHGAKQQLAATYTHLLGLAQSTRASSMHWAGKKKRKRSNGVKLELHFTNNQV
jgi:hypothetical protein